MAISFSVTRYASSSVAPKSPNRSLHKFLDFNSYSSSAAENFMSVLEKDAPHVEKTLDALTAKLDSKCITQVLEKCAANKPQLGIRFFIWAALHPTHRHTSYMYFSACKLLGVDRNPKIIADVIDTYRAEGSVVGVKTFKVVLNMCRAANNPELALRVLRKMKEFNCRPDTVSYNVVVRLLAENARLDEALGLMKEMGLIDLYPDMVTYMSIIKGLCDSGQVEKALGLVKTMKLHRCEPNAVVYSTLLDGICLHGNLELALEFLTGMESENGESNPNLVTYTIMVKGFVEKGRSLEAVRLLNRMEDFGVRPNKVTFITLLDGLCREGHVKEASDVVDRFSSIVGREDELRSWLVVSLMRAGKHKESEKVFRMMMARGLRPGGHASGAVIEKMVSERRVMEGFLLLDGLVKSGNLLGIDSDVYTFLLEGLCQENRFVEVGKLVRVMIQRKIRVKSVQAEDIIGILNNCGEYDLASDVARIRC
ncbi:pentatricopeptide repeat-containing protein [Striga asiatica]|uniref:Pentatricopeptide repeat-containing protein n=1 Tax=Striga asiatica TaxID=4170 RepID=A0A5A7QX84_STRAF|nr:pentatricopeptide repeat-containing protein [Striga asiatica]